MFDADVVDSNEVSETELSSKKLEGCNDDGSACCAECAIVASSLAGAECGELVLRAPTWYVIGCLLVVVFFVLHQGLARFYSFTYMTLSYVAASVSRVNVCKRRKAG